MANKLNNIEAPKKMDDETLAGIIDIEVTNSVGLAGSELSGARVENMEYYLGEPFGNEVADRSQVVMSDVQDTVEWIMPSLMKIFTQSDIVGFKPEGEEDKAGADQATDYTNYIFNRQNDGFTILMTWFKDALINKVGVVKSYWDSKKEETREEYEGLTEEEFQLLISDPNIELLEVTDNEGSYSVAVSKTVDMSKVTIDPVPQEEFLISKRAKTIEDARFCGHKTKQTINDLRESGFDISSIEFGSDSSIENNIEANARNSKDQADESVFDDIRDDQGMQEVTVIEGYVKVDYDGDGISELRKVTVVGKSVLSNEVVDRKPFHSITPIPLPHKLHGLAVADLVKDLQLIKSTLMRQLLDNMYSLNNGRFEVVEGMVNLDDLLTSRPNGIVRVKAQGSVKRLDQPALDQSSFNMLGYIDNLREERSGVSKNTKGLNEGALASHTSGVAVNQVLSAAEQRVELIARVFAETGVKSLFRDIYHLAVEYDTKENFVELRGGYETVDPSRLKKRWDMVTKVGLGRGDKEKRLLQLSQFGQVLAQVAAQDPKHKLISPQNVYNFVKEYQGNTDLPKNVEFITDPSTLGPEQLSPPDPTLLLAQATIKNQELELKIKEKELMLKELKINEDIRLRDDENKADFIIDKEKNDIQRSKAT